MIGRNTLAALCAALLPAGLLCAAEVQTYDIVVYGATSGGAAAAVQAARMGKSVVLIEPGQHVGGLTSGGLGATDIGNKAAIGGVSREFYRRVKKHYDAASAWKFETREEYTSRRQAPGEDTMWTFEPAVAERILRDMLGETRVELVCGERLDLRGGVEKQGNRVASIRMESGRRFRGRVLIDCTYEGDLMALAGVSFHVGRESVDTYGESLNGVQTAQAKYHQFVPGVDPYVRPGDPKSGLLPGLHAGPPGDEGAGDDRVQAYCFRMCLTDAEANRIPFEKPDGYDPLRYELLLRDLEAGETVIPWSPTLMPNRKTDTNNNRGFSTDNIGMNYAWANGDYATRDRIFQEHLQYQRGLMWTLANHPRVPESMRREVSRWGNCRDELPENRGWSHQIYVREARRMISSYVMTQDNCQGLRTAEDPVGLAAYGMDSHNIQRYVDAKGHVKNEGDVQVGGFAPYGISYRAIVPKEDQCANLIVPVCLSASHIAYGSIRMEPVFMVLGQSAASAAAQAIDEQVPVQRIDYAKFRKRIVADGQIIEWTGPKPRTAATLNPRTMKGIVLDDEALERTGTWLSATSVAGYVGSQYWHDDNEAQGTKQAKFRFEVPSSGRFEVRLAYTPNPNRATNVLVTVQHAGGKSEQRINQRIEPPIDRSFVSLGTFDLAAKTPYAVVISNEGADGHVIADAVQLLPAK